MLPALNDRDNFTSDFVVAREPACAHGHAIAMQYRAHFVFGEKEIVATLIEFREAVTVGMADDGCQ
jgi:hypothetical protein